MLWKTCTFIHPVRDAIENLVLFPIVRQLYSISSDIRFNINVVLEHVSLEKSMQLKFLMILFTKQYSYPFLDLLHQGQFTMCSASYLFWRMQSAHSWLTHKKRSFLNQWCWGTCNIVHLHWMWRQRSKLTYLFPVGAQAKYCTALGRFTGVTNVLQQIKILLHDNYWEIFRGFCQFNDGWCCNSCTW